MNQAHTIRWVKRLLLMAVSAAVALLIVEGALRVFMPTFSPLTFDLFYRGADGQLRLQPLARRQHAHPEWNVAIQTNREGFRDSDEAPADGQPLILGLGDSLTFGWGVECHEAYLTRLETSLGGPRGGVRVIKTGIPGTGTTDHLAMLRTLLAKHRRVDLVLAAFYVGNDFNDVAEGGARQFDVVDGLLVRRGETGEGPGPFTRGKNWLKRHSYAAQLAAQWLWERERRRTEQTDVRDRPHSGLAQRDYWLQQYTLIHLRDPLPARLQQGVDGALAALGEMRQLARERGARFVLLVIPRSIQIYDSDRERYAAAFGAAPEAWDMDRPQRILAEWARRNDVEAIDPLPAMRQAASQGAPRLYFFPDSHLTREGHRVIAEQLQQHLAQRPLAAEAAVRR